MRIDHIEDELIAEIPFLNAGKGAGSFYVDKLPIHLGYASRLPAGISALIVTADLQGREKLGKKNGFPPRLLGQVLPKMLAHEILPLLDLPSQQIGVVLAGDFYTVPNLDKRGGTGDVTPVWKAFADQFDWVVGVAGNHDLFGTKDKAYDQPRLPRNCYFLDKDYRSINDMKFAGVGGIIGNPRRVWRKTEEQFADAVLELADHRPEILIMHDGPNSPLDGYRGSSSIRETLAVCPPMLVIRGHAHWPAPLARLSSGHQVLNVDARVVILLQQSK